MKQAVIVLAMGLALLSAAFVEASGAETRRAQWFDDDARNGASRAAALFASVSGHLRASGGDVRFADRLAADPAVVQELLADIAFAQHRGRIERPQLVKFALTSVRPVGLEIAEVRAREFWITKSETKSGPTTRSDVVSVRYAMRRGAGGWRVADWLVADGDGATPGAVR